MNHDFQVIGFVFLSIKVGVLFNSSANMQYNRIIGIIPTTHYKENMVVDFNAMIEDLINDKTRNKKIAALIDAFDARIIIATTNLHHLDKIQEYLPKDTILKLGHDEVDEIISHNSLSDVLQGHEISHDIVTMNSKYFKRLLGMSYSSLEKIINHVTKLDSNIPNIFTGLGAVIIAAPHKEIGYILEYVDTYHCDGANRDYTFHPPALAIHSPHPDAKEFDENVNNNKSKKRVIIYDIIDNQEMLNMWTHWHEDRFQRLTTLGDKSEAKTDDRRKSISNIVHPVANHAVHSVIHTAVNTHAVRKSSLSPLKEENAHIRETKSVNKEYK